MFDDLGSRGLNRDIRHDTGVDGDCELVADRIHGANQWLVITVTFNHHCHIVDADVSQSRRGKLHSVNVLTTI